MGINIYADLPEVIEIINIEDAGEGGAASCPHCGAIGRYIYHFVTVGGEHHGAMRGCYGKFPKSKYLARMTEILKKEIDLKKRGRNLASWDEDIKRAIRAYADGAEIDVDEVIRRADNAKRAYMTRMGYR